VVSAQDQTSVANYFPRSYERTLYNTADTEAVDAAYFLLSRYKDPHLRPETIKLTPVRNPAIWSTALGLEIGDLVRVNKRPIGGTAIAVDCFVERVEHSYDAQTADWITTVTLSPVFGYYWNLSSITGTADNTSSTNTLVVAKSTSIATARDIVAGQLLQGVDNNNPDLYAVAVVYGQPTETATKVTIPIRLIGLFDQGYNGIKSTTLAGNILLDSINTCALSSTALNGTTGSYLIDSEIITGSVTGSTLTITARAQNSTLQTASGTDDTGANSVSHLAGATIYYINASNVQPYGTWTEVLPNQLTRKPYSVATITQNAVSKLGSWYNTLRTGTYTTAGTTAFYNQFTVNPIEDILNYPQSDIAVGQLLTLVGSSNETVAVAEVNVPAADTTWTFTGYKVTQSAATLSADVGIDTTTITTSSAVTATVILVGNEFMRVTAGSGTTSLTVVRGTPELARFGILSCAPHYVRDKIYVATNAGCTSTYSAGSAIIEGYNQPTVITGTARLGY
jgi:hypothetical protein